MRNSLACMRLQRGRTLVINSMETIAHVRKAAHRGDVVVSLKVNHALAIAMEGGHAKMKWSILLLDAHPATAQLKEKMKQSVFLLEVHRATAQKKMKQNLLHVLWRLTVQIESIAHAKRTAHPVIVVVS